MPIPRNWLEELVCEWLQLKGYRVESNVRLGSGRRGGAKEADVVGLRLLKKPEEREEGRVMREVLEIVHVEVGSLARDLNKNLKAVRGKFSEDRVEAVKRRSLKAIELESAFDTSRFDYSRLDASDIDYERIYIANYVAKRQVDDLKNELKKDGIEFLTLRELLHDVVKTIREWRRAQVKEGFRRGEGITLPESLWLLNLIDAMDREGLLVESKANSL